MKAKYTLIWALAIFYLPLMAQENKTIKEETTITKIVKKEGSQVIVTEVTNTEQQKGALMIEGNDKVDQQYFEDNESAKENQVTVERITIDQDNEAAIEAAKKEQEKALHASIEAEKEKAAVEKQILEEKRQAQQRELEENRKRLESRPKGMSKLKTKKDN
jgi:hypothetical protein